VAKKARRGIKKPVASREHCIEVRGTTLFRFYRAWSAIVFTKAHALDFIVSPLLGWFCNASVA
jgi:hypothetical protein